MSMQKKNPYLLLWLLLAVALAIFIVISFSEGLKIGNYEMKQGAFREQLLEEREEEPLAEAEGTAGADPLVQPEEEGALAETDTTVKSVLVIGDSNTVLIARRLADYGVKNGYKVTSVTWDGSSTIAWSSTDKFDEGMQKGHPDFIFVSLGGNESTVRDKAARAKYVKKLLARFGKIPFVWIGPQMQPADRQYDKMMLELLPKGTYFVTNMKLEMGPDNIHPTGRGAAVMVDSVMRWMPKSAHPIRSELPGPQIKGSRFNHIYYKVNSDKPESDVKKETTEPAPAPAAAPEPEEAPQPASEE